MKRETVLILCFATRLASACSGPGARDAMEVAKRSAHMGAVAQFLLVLLSVGLRLRISTAVSVVLLVVHPAWTQSPYSGDCGMMQESSTLLFALISLGAFAWDLLRRKRPP